MQDDARHPADVVSALVDGELDGEATHSACLRWRDDAQVRANWHAYHLIGDVLRSDALASAAEHDERFLQRLRERLAGEPVLLAPQPAPAARPPGRASARWSWLAPAAVAAGFMAVASVLVVTRLPSPAAGEPGAVMAQAAPQGRVAMAQSAPPQAGVSSAAVSSLAEPQAFVADSRVVRDARLDRYLAAHMEFGGSSALGAPSGFLRAATARPLDR